MEIMAFESKYGITEKTPKSSATGLIQFIEKPMKGLGIATKDEAVGQVEDRRDHYRQEREDTVDFVKEPWRIKYEKKNI